MDRSISGRVSGRIRRLLERRSYLPGLEPVALDELVSPLRYDIIVRIDHFRFLDQHLALLERDLEAYLRLAIRHPYFTWWTRVALPRFRPRELRDERRTLEAFRQRVVGAAALWRSFNAVGFDPRYPVTLRIALPGVATPAGKVVQRRFHAGDGCHRLAMVLAAGQDILPPAWYRVRTDPLRTLTDNTRTLIGPLALGRDEYYRFLGRGYGLAGATGREEIIRHVETHAPDRLPELQQVLAVDERELDAAAAGRADREPGSYAS
jgi:hypothetical protein